MHRIPIREYITKAERERAEKAQKAIDELRKDWLFKMVSPEAQTRLIHAALRATSA